MFPEVLSAAKQYFGLDAESISALGSCQDLNFKLKCVDGRVFVVKYTNSTVDEEDVHFQHSVKRYLLDSPLNREVVFPEPVPRVDCPAMTTVQQTLDGQQYTMHILSYVSGKMLSDFSYYHEDTLQQFGKVVAQLSQTLLGYPHPARPRESEWDLRRAVQMCESHSEGVADKGKWMPLVRDVDALLASRTAGLRVQLVHGDLAPYNVIAGLSANGRPFVKGVIDFGDVTSTWLVGELAVAVTPLLSQRSRPPLDYLTHIVRGFAAITPLTPDEAYSLWPMVVLRTISLHLTVQGLLQAEPGNDYLREESELNRRAAEYVISIPLDIGISAVMLAAGISYRQRSDEQVCAMLGTPDEVLDLDLSATSLFYNSGEWLHEQCFEHVLQALSGPKAQLTPVGQPWLLATELRCLTAPATVPTFSLLSLPPGAQLLFPAPCSCRIVEQDASWANRKELKHWIDGQQITELVCSGHWAMRIVGPQIISGEHVRGNVMMCNTSSAVQVLLLQAVFRPSVLLPIHAPPLFVDPSDWQLWSAFVISPKHLLHVVGSLEAVHDDQSRQASLVLSARYAAVAAPQEHYYRSPPQIERAYREFMYDVSGRAYLDLVNNVAIAGHCHEQVIAAAHKQFMLLNTNSRFIYSAMSSFAEKILSTIPLAVRDAGKLNKIFFVNSGSEATDLALRIARTVATERRARSKGLQYASKLDRDTICITGGYHGVTTASDEVSTTLNDNPRSLETRASWIHLVPMPNLYRGMFRAGDEDVAQKYAGKVKEKISELVAAGTPPSVFIAEPLSGNAGGVEIPPGYLSEVYDAVREVGGLCICDEVQVGYGRLGNSFWGFQEHGVIPDIITMAKAAGNGQPLGFVIVGEDIVSDFHASQGSFFSSAGGGPVTCAIGAAVLDIIQQERMQENAREVGTYLHEQLLALQAKHPNIIGCIHGHGLYQGIELVHGGQTANNGAPMPATAEAYAICERLLELGVINHNTGDHSNVLKVKPPLYFSKEDADFFVQALDVALNGW